MVSYHESCFWNLCMPFTFLSPSQSYTYPSRPDSNHLYHEAFHEDHFILPVKMETIQFHGLFYITLLYNYFMVESFHLNRLLSSSKPGSPFICAKKSLNQTFKKNLIKLSFIQMDKDYGIVFLGVYTHVGSYFKSIIHLFIHFINIF